MSAPRLHHEALPGLGPRAFLLHGMLSSTLQWQPNLPALSRCLRPVLFDLWGHGRSPAPTDDRDYGIDAIVGQLEAVRAALNEPRLVLVGQSFGAGLAMHYALQHPDRVQALIFTNAVSPFWPPDDEAMRASRLRMAADIETRGREGIAALPMHPRGGKRLPAELKDRLVAAADAVVPEAAAQLVRITAARLSVANRLGELRCPVLLVNGRFEAGFQPLRDAAQASIADCQVVDLDAGHAVNLEAAAGFDAAVTDFIERLLVRPLSHSTEVSLP